MRRKSMAIDKNDLARLWRGRSEQGGTISADEVQEPYPFFFTPEGTSVNLTGIYRGAAAFLIAAGPSFARVDKTRLDRVWTMTLNNATASYRGNANCIVDDPSRFNLSTWLDPTIQKFVPMAAFEKPLWDNRLLTGAGVLRQQWHKSDVKV